MLTLGLIQNQEISFTNLRKQNSEYLYNYYELGKMQIHHHSKLMN